MKSKNLKRKATTLTCFELSKRMAEIGRKRSPSNIRGDWSEGAPKDTAENYLLWLEQNHPGAGVDTKIKATRLEKLEREIDVLRQTEIREKRKNRKADGELIEAVVVEQGAAIATQIFFAELENIKRDFPPLVEGRDAKFIRLKLDARFKLAEQKTREAFARIHKPEPAK